MTASVAFELSINLIETFLVTWFYTTYLGSKYNGTMKYISFLIMWVFAFAEVCIVNYITFFESIATYIPIIIYFVFGIIFLKGHIMLKLWISLIAYIVVTIVAVVSNLSICYLIGYSPVNMILEFNSIRVISVIITKLILFISYIIILQGRRKNPIKNKLWYMLIIIPIMSVFSICKLMEIALRYEEVMGIILAGMLCSVASNIIIYYFYTVISKEYDNKLKVSLLEQQNENAKRQISESDAFVKQMKTLRHDIKNHLLTIDGYIDRGCSDDARSYIKELNGDYVPNVYSMIETNNIAFDAIVNAKLAICNQKGIFMEIKVKQGAIDNFDAVDTGVLFGNLIDNAIDAAENTEARHICIEIQPKGNYLSILISNSINSSVLESNEELLSTKSDKEHHGIGLKSVHGIVKKYDGTIDFFEENGEFNCYILLFIN